jgi:hypothetical protein
MMWRITPRELLKNGKLNNSKGNNEQRRNKKHGQGLETTAK